MVFDKNEFVFPYAFNLYMQTPAQQVFDAIFVRNLPDR